MSIMADGGKLFTPSFVKNFWHVIDGGTGEAIGCFPSEKLAHNTIIGRDGNEAYLADRGSRMVEVAAPGGVEQVLLRKDIANVRRLTRIAPPSTEKSR